MLCFPALDRCLAGWLQEEEEWQALLAKVEQLDQQLLAALDSGLPPCAGVALGIDRLLMLALGATDLSPVMAFGRDLI